jgi:hypothetical protein
MQAMVTPSTLSFEPPREYGIALDLLSTVPVRSSRSRPANGVRQLEQDGMTEARAVLLFVSH